MPTSEFPFLIVVRYATDCNLQVHRNIKNLNIKSFCADGYVLKVLNSFDSKKIGFIEGQTALSLYLSKYKNAQKGDTKIIFNQTKRSMVIRELALVKM